ncbi:MAG TPA: thermonuclease family protein [Gaiellaceae bacterium]|nr:thermonuclease family protein [Gaiellaceae bacterium]
MSLLRLLPIASLAILLCVVTAAGATPRAGVQVGRIDHVADGDTVDLTNGDKIRLVQIDTPEVYFTPECYGEQASALTKRLLPPGTLVRLLPEPATDSVDQYGRLLRYVIRVRDGLNVNVQLVRVGAAAPYFYDARRGRYAALLDRLALRARARKLGLWGLCRGTPFDPDRGVDSGALNTR